MSFATISVIGLGYIGLPTAAAFASRQKQVIGVDINQHAVDTINRGEIHIVEPDLASVVKTAVEGGFLRASTTPVEADAWLIAVPTPFKGDHEPDMTYVESAARSIAPVLKKGALVILESTSPVGSTEKMAEWLAEMRPDLTFPQQVGEQADVNIAYCPERVLPGQVMVELIKNDRVIGGMTPVCSARASELYKIFLEGECVVTNSRTAEMCKLTENSFRDVNIAFANELSLICADQGINVWELIRLANRHPRVNILQPGPGVGGHCIAVDPWFIVAQNPQQARLIRTAREVNDHKPFWVIDQVKAAVADCLAATDKRASELKIACFGLAFKPNIDDLRESPAMEIAELIAQWHSGETLVVEPNIHQLPKKLTGLCTLAQAPSSPYSASKASSDHLVRAWLRTYGLPTLITNCSNNYGPYHFPEKLIPLMILNALAGKSLPVYGNGQQIRDWLYVEDHARALYCVATTGKVGETYNIGGHNERKNLDVVETICELLEELAPNKPHGVAHYRDLITFVADRPGHDLRYAIDASKIARELGWLPQETFESGMRKTVQWYLANESWWKQVQDGSYQGERLGLKG